MIALPSLLLPYEENSAQTPEFNGEIDEVKAAESRCEPKHASVGVCTSLINIFHVTKIK